MKVLLDTDIVIDVLQKRAILYEASARVIGRAIHHEIEGTIPSHSMTTIYYLMQKYFGSAKAKQIIDWLLENFIVAHTTDKTFKKARVLDVPDFEDAVVMAIAEEQNCNYIVTNNITHFKHSHVKALTPVEFLKL